MTTAGRKRFPATIDYAGIRSTGLIAMPVEDSCAARLMSAKS